MTTNGREHGTVTFWSHDRNYGFVRPDAGERDIFVHGSAFPAGEVPRIRDRCSYEIGADRRPNKPPRTCAVRARIEDAE
jgi:cold shock protein